MSKEKGFLIFFDWITAFESLSPKDFKTLMLAMWRYQMDGTPPPEFSNKAKALATFIFPQIDRRKHMSEIGRLGAEKVNCKNTAATARRKEAGVYGDGVARGVATAQVRVKSESKSKSKTKSKSESESESESKSDAVSSLRERDLAYSLDTPTGSADARAERCEEYIFGEKEDGSAEGRKAWGRYGNVYLSTEEYLAICQKIGSADAYIDRFSEKLHSKGYRYPDHFKAICEWWERDKGFERQEPQNTGSEGKTTGSFDTDKFFEAAVRRSLGEETLACLDDGTPD